MQHIFHSVQMLYPLALNRVIFHFHNAQYCFCYLGKLNIFCFELVKSRIICYYNSMEKHKMIILGGGASGCMCALATECKDVCIIDRQNKIGKKILVTGNGRCNITNRNCSDDKYNTSIEKYLERFSSFDTLRFFSNLGLESFFDSEGRAYPLSNSAKSVVNVIENALTKKHVCIRHEEEIQELSKQGQLYIVRTDKNEYACEKLVIATGGSGGEVMLNSLGISFFPFIPRLCRL